MSEFTKCPNCLREKLIVPLRGNSSSMACPLCESVF